MKRILILAMATMLCYVVTAQENNNGLRWYYHFYVNDYASISVPMSPMLHTGYSIDLAGEYRPQMEHPNQGWALGLRMNERVYNYTNQTIEGSNLVSAEVSMTDLTAGAVYRLQPFRKLSVGLFAFGGMTVCDYPTITAASEQISVVQLLPLARAECAVEWHFFASCSISFAVGYTQHMRCSPFSPDLLHDGYFHISLGLVGSFL